MRRVIKLASGNDFTIVSEAHCLSGRADAMRLPSHLTALWSNGTASVAGIGLILHRDFLKKFVTIDPGRDWVEVIPGRVAILKLRGSQGALDIVCAYLPTGDATCAAHRKNAIIDIGSHIRPRDEVLTVMAGDFNFVEDERDRYCTLTGDWTGSKDSGEAEVFRDHIRTPHCMYEFEQNHFTCEAGGARSRIDRMYTNQHVSFQLDRHITCNVLEWDKHLSVHRPITFSRTAAKPKDPGQKPIPIHEFAREGWKETVLENFHYLCRGDPTNVNPARRLLLLKDAIRNVHELRKEDSQIHDGSACAPDDRLGFAMGCLKAVESGRGDWALNCARAYPKLMEWIPRVDNDIHLCDRLASIREHVLELAREQIQADIHSINTAEGLEQEDRHNAKESILRKLKRLAPGETSGIGAMADGQGSIVTKPEEIAQVLRSHWKGVFSEKSVRDASVQIWMEELFLKDDSGCFITGLPDRGDRIWRISRKSVKLAIQTAKNSMPGPDGIPSAAFRALGDIAVDIFLEVATALGSSDGREMLRVAYEDRCPQGLHDFNLSLLCCLPKKPFGSDPEHGEFFRGEDTRPLALVNTDNRIIASAARIAWEPLLNSFICKAQQGFLRGRQMINNVIDIDYDSMRVSLKCRRGMLVLFDFKAAFPSIAHSFMKTSLSAIGLPEHVLSFIEALYDRNYCNISFRGQIFDGFDMLCGVRQGCPISPLLFAAAVDVLLRKLQKAMPASTIRAFADDIGAVLEDWDRDGIIAENIFREFADMSGLELNIEKTTAIPLWENGWGDVEQTLRHSDRHWRNMCIAEEGTYLGFCVGPGRCGKSWSKPLVKFSQRCKLWGGLGVGLMFSTAAYNTFASSTLGFVAQLEEPTDHVLDTERRGIIKMLPGPGKWCQEHDAFYFRESWGQKASFNSVRVTSAAAKLRAKYVHDCCRRRGDSYSTTSIKDMAGRILAFCRSGEYMHRFLVWEKWYYSSYPAVLDRNEDMLKRACGISVGDLLRDIAGAAPPWSLETRKKQRKLLQRAASKQLLAHFKPHPLNRLRAKLDRWFESKGNMVGWALAGPPAHIVARVHKHMQKLPHLVAPRVCAAVLRSVFNGWCSRRRFQERDHPDNICVLGCGGGAEDCIEHYCRCPALLDTLKNRLRVNLPIEKALSFWVMNEPCLDLDDMLVCSAIINYAGYMATNKFRNTKRASDHDTARNAINQFVTQSAIGHPATARFLDNRWSTPVHHVI